MPGLRFALNHTAAPGKSPEAFFALARDGGADAIRSDLAGNAILDGTPAGRMRALAQAAGVRILSINARQRFEDWRAPRPTEAAALADFAHGLVTAGDRIGNVERVRALVAGGYGGHVSLEPFAPEIRALDPPAGAIRRSMELIREGVGVAA